MNSFPFPNINKMKTQIFFTKLTLRYFALLIFLISLTVKDSLAQNDPCASGIFDIIETNQQLQGDDSYVNYVNSGLGNILEDYIIPTVVHVMYDSSDELVSEYDVFEAINRVNDYLDQGGELNSHIQLQLANLDPNGNCTNGIEYWLINNSNVVPTLEESSPISCAISDLELKNISRWDVDRYLNIWVVGGIFSDTDVDCSDSGIGGYALVPGTDWRILQLMTC